MALQKLAQKRLFSPVEVVHKSNLFILHWSEVALDNGRPSPVGREKENNITGDLHTKGSIVLCTCNMYMHM